MTELQKDAKGYIKYIWDVKTELHNGYKLSLTVGKVDTNGDFLEREYWAKEEELLMVHSAFFKFIRDFGLPRVNDGIWDEEGELLKVYRVYVNYERETPTVEIDAI